MNYYADLRTESSGGIRKIKPYFDKKVAEIPPFAEILLPIKEFCVFKLNGRPAGSLQSTIFYNFGTNVSSVNRDSSFYANTRKKLR